MASGGTLMSITSDTSGIIPGGPTGATRRGSIAFMRSTTAASPPAFSTQVNTSATTPTVIIMPKITSMKAMDL